MEQSGHTIILAAHIDDFVIVCADRTTLDKFSTRLLDVFDGTYEGAIHTYLGCEIERDLIAGTTILSQRHYAEDILRTYGAHTEPGIVFFGMSRKVLSFIVVGFLSMNHNSLSTILTFSFLPGQCLVKGPEVTPPVRSFHSTIEASWEVWAIS